MRFHVIRGVVSAFMALSFFYAITKLPLAETIAFLGGGRPDKPRLSRRQTEILHLVAQGMTDKQISQRVFLGAQTVRNRVSRMLAVLGRENRTQLALLFSGLDESARSLIFAGR